MEKIPRFPNVYVDIDGVLADFVAGMENKFNVSSVEELLLSSKYKHLYKNSIYEVLHKTDFFYKLYKFETADKLIEIVEGFSDNGYSILSKPFEDDIDNSIYWKRKWLKENIKKRLPKKVIFSGKKHDYAIEIIDNNKIPNLLIDDYEKNCKEFKEEGGEAILYDASIHSLDYIKGELKKVFEK